jgi:hypothetical protein
VHQKKPAGKKFSKAQAPSCGPVHEGATRRPARKAAKGTRREGGPFESRPPFHSITVIFKEKAPSTIFFPSRLHFLNYVQLVASFNFCCILCQVMGILEPLPLFFQARP